MIAEDAVSLRALATQCRRLAKGVSGREVAQTLRGMATDYDRQAEAAAVREADAAPAAVPPARGA
jgi:hypothetical protein